MQVTVRVLKCDRRAETESVSVGRQAADGRVTSLFGPFTIARDLEVHEIAESVELDEGDALVILTDGGGTIGAPYVVPAEADAPPPYPYPWFRDGDDPRSGALFTLMIEVTPEPEPEEPADAGNDGACGAESGEGERMLELHLPRGLGGTVRVPDDDLGLWPRYTFARLREVETTAAERAADARAGRAVRERRNKGFCYRWDPDNPSSPYEYTRRDLSRYYAQTRPTLSEAELRELPGYRRRLSRINAPHRSYPSTWGRQTRLRFPACTLEGTPGSERTLTFDPSRHDAWWTLTIYNLESREGVMPQPAWLRFIERTVMRLPMEHLRWTRLRGIYLNFQVGSPLDWGNIASGGGNLPNTAQTVGIEDRSALAILSCSYPAMNRPWADDDWPTSVFPRGEDADQEIDRSFHERRVPPGQQSAASSGEESPGPPVQGTFLHEFGHLLDLTPPSEGGDFAGAPAELATQADAHRAAVSAGRGHDAAWGAYKSAVHYQGSTQGSGEGMAEGYRKLLSGVPLGGGAAGEAVAELMRNAGFPSPASVAEAARAIEDYLNTDPDHVIS